MFILIITNYLAFWSFRKCSLGNDAVLWDHTHHFDMKSYKNLHTKLRKTFSLMNKISCGVQNVGTWICFGHVIKRAFQNTMNNLHGWHQTSCLLYLLLPTQNYLNTDVALRMCVRHTPTYLRKIIEDRSFFRQLVGQIISIILILLLLGCEQMRTGGCRRNCVSSGTSCSAGRGSAEPGTRGSIPPHAWLRGNATPARGKSTTSKSPICCNGDVVVDGRT